MPEVHDALARAVATRPARRPWWHPSRRAGLLAVGALIATGSAVAGTGAWNPILGDDHRGHPEAARGPIPSAQLAALGVLRRAQVDGDRGRDVEAILRLLARGEINGIHTDGVRVLRRRRDGVTIVVPAERVGRHDKGHPSSIRRNVLCVLSGVRSSGTNHTFRGFSAGQVCGDVRQLRTTGIGASVNTDRGFLAGALVPDGVVRVVISLRRHRKVTATVRDNYYEVNTGREIAPAWGVRWLDADGRKIEHRAK